MEMSSGRRSSAQSQHGIRTPEKGTTLHDLVWARRNEVPPGTQGDAQEAPARAAGHMARHGVAGGWPGALIKGKWCSWVQPEVSQIQVLRGPVRERGACQSPWGAHTRFMKPQNSFR